MAINPYHIVEELNGTRCSIVEKKVSAERAGFLKAILEASGQDVMTTTAEDGSVTVGVTNVVFNAMYALYARSLRTPNGKLVIPSYWYQKQQTDQFYWDYK